MIVFDLSCDNGHVFEGWFGSSTDFASQQGRGLVSCPSCGSTAVTKAPMAPAVGKKGSQQTGRNLAPSSAPPPAAIAPMTKGPMPAEVKEAIARLAEVQAKALKDSQWVGRKFAEESRKIHYGESDGKAIHGEATREEAAQLIDEGIAIAPLPLPVAPPDKLN